MHPKSAGLEIFRWGYVNFPAVLFYYAKEMDLEIDDLGMLAAVFYSFEKSKPLYQSGIRIGQLLQDCPCLSKAKLSRKLNRLEKLEIISVQENRKNFVDRYVFLEPLIDKLENLIIRDHPQLSTGQKTDQKFAESQINNEVSLLEEYRHKIEQLELELQEEKGGRVSLDVINNKNGNYKKVADFISKKTGNLMSVKMAGELNKWLEEMSLTPEILLCMLELCFERSIYNPRDITRIARDIKEYSINTVEGLESYFTNYVDVEKNKALRVNKFDPDIAEFGSFTGIDMAAEARKKVYYKWRYDWRFSHQMIMKAGEIMCQRTKNGGLEYIDSVLNNWMSKEIRQVSEADNEISKFKTRNRNEKIAATINKNDNRKALNVEYEIYVPPSSIEELKSKV
ncbi:MAG: DnaD domain protein [Syntrophomonadaceae bacterium]|nr:DnaD domain protein [Syntrophomonadaceae bacterium]MDD3023110.1 DnaD domain protein [Syntrophomonadaceae bacterium]